MNPLNFFVNRIASTSIKNFNEIAWTLILSLTRGRLGKGTEAAGRWGLGGGRRHDKRRGGGGGGWVGGKE